MTTNTTLSLTLQKLPRRRRGFALVMVVAMIALMMAVIVAFLSVARQGSREASIEAEKERARLVAQNAANVALAQLRDATSQFFPDGTPKPWTSQPGAVRVHNMDGSLGTLFKLYTADSMTTGSLGSVTVDVPDDWAARPDDFVDLNAPKVSANGELRFPVVDPRAWTADPLQSVEGFHYQEFKGAVGPASSGPDGQRLPMPVRWVYQLQDGTLGTLGPGGQFIPAGGSRASRANPIVARFAFWVDDETCKINVNTASEGSFWDSPRADTEQERALAKTVPSRLEYMRHPGHPAGVCLSSVLLPNRRLSPMEFPVDHPLMTSMELEDARDLWRLGRLTEAETLEHISMGGTVEANWEELWQRAPNESVRQPRYASVGEMLFDHVDIARFPSLWETPQPPPGERRRSLFFGRHPEAAQRLERSRFFLTAASSGPEVTLFGTPRVAIWPMHAQTLLNGSGLGDPETSRDTSFNHKVMLAAMVKGRPYFVQRSEPGNGANDFQVHAQGSNRALYEYLQRLTDKPFPGFERPSQGYSTFAEKYEEDRDAILMAMLDYVRSANFAEHQLPGTMQFSVLCPGVEHEGFGQIAPMQPRIPLNQAAASNHVQGLGRVLTISEVALIITCRAERDENGEIRGEPSTGVTLQPGDREYDVGFLVEGFLPGHSWVDYRPYATAALFGGLPGAAPNTKDPFPELFLNGIPLVPDAKTIKIESAELPPSSWHGAGAALGVRGLSHGVLQFKPIVIPSQRDGEGNINPQPPVLRFQGTTNETHQLKIALYDSPGSTGAADLLQVVPLVLPDIPVSADTDIRLPRLGEGALANSLAERLRNAAAQGTPFLAATDVVQSLAPIHGDYRLTAMQRWVESRDGSRTTPVFTPHPLWGKQRLAHNLRDATLPVEPSQKGYIHNLLYAAAFRPDMPDTLSDDAPHVSVWQSGDWVEYTLSLALDELRLDGGRRGPALPEWTGDFDNGIGNTPDGPYSNRPDDGHWAAMKAGMLPYFDNVSQTGATVPPVSLAAFAPQRLLPSPVMFGSLPTGSRAHVPWQTLLFRPHEQPFGTQHFGAHTPPDHLLLDLFWQPVLEPEPLSLNLETQGKINLNQQILPFTHITRDTALHAAMKAETLMAIPDSAAATYKSGERPEDRFRRHIDAEQTLALWKTRVFDQGNVFLIPGQICEQYLVPEGLMEIGQRATQERMSEFWAQHRLTGDNSKERPYAHLYSRLTTRSNTYRVHFVAQTLVKARSTPANGFDSRRDRVTATVSGSSVLSRQLDLNHPNLPDYQQPSAAGETLPPLDLFYRWHAGAVE